MLNEQQQPSVGRIVHYVARGSADGRFPKICRAAIITEAADVSAFSDWSAVVGLVVLNPTGFFFHPLASGGCRYEVPSDSGELPDGGTWHWPERTA